MDYDLILNVFFGGQKVNYRTEFYDAISSYCNCPKLILTRRFSRFLYITVRGAQIILVNKFAKKEPCGFFNLSERTQAILRI
jgi:hypothetical protein